MTITALMDAENLTCPICAGACAMLDVVDFNKSCEEARGKFLPLAGSPVYYARCSGCAFCFAPALYRWTLAEFEQRIYNAEYVQVDPDYLDARPRANASSLLPAFGKVKDSFNHLDYGGGSGLLSRLLRESGWNSVSYDPFVDRSTDVRQLGTFDMITAYEVFEHVPDVEALMSDLCSLLAPSGIVLFSTLLSDENLLPNQRITWWYASPRNGHISLFSRRSLEIVAQKRGMQFRSFSPGFHILFTQIPAWAAQVIKMA
jgi:SAM-dependent methyltransferase